MLIHKNGVLANKVVFYNNFILRAIGLRLSKPLKDQALVLVSPSESISKTSIDMLFVFFAIDVLWLNSNCEVVDLRKNVRPFSFLICPKTPAKYVVELPAGVIKNVQIGDKVSFLKSKVF